MQTGVYENSILLTKIRKRINAKKPVRLAFLDIDDTMTGSPHSTNITRKRLEQLGYAIIYVTARTEEMLMTSTAYNKSKANGFHRPAPLLGREKEKYVYLAPELIEPAGLLDPDIIAGSTGTQILVKQTDGAYLQDTRYEMTHSENANTWRKDIMRLVELFNTPVKRAFPALYEDPANYESGKTNVYQPKYRIALTFQSNKQKIEFRKFLREQQQRYPAAKNITLNEDSQPSKELYVLYLMPKNMSKTKAVDHIIDAVLKATGITLSQMEVLIAGDGHADFDMGMKAARGTCTTFLLAGGSRLAHAVTCTNDHPTLLDKELEQLKLAMSKLKMKGRYRHPTQKNRNIIISDQVYRGKVAVESLLSLVKELELL